MDKQKPADISQSETAWPFQSLIKRNRVFDVSIPGVSGGQMEYVDQTTSFQPPAVTKLTSNNMKLNGYSVAIVTLP